ncbi:hypothetical protein GCM10010253_40340 [Streptomyces badius]|uniref:Uncharacterized protein n=1 Tax=Streptomyces badius TaxID=1941 RepID=A0ABQ2TB05_STRBA|nr:hypothetical protein GCM10010253_40340 [Streptomyces badius]
MQRQRGRGVGRLQDHPGPDMFRSVLQQPGGGGQAGLVGDQHLPGEILRGAVEPGGVVDTHRVAGTRLGGPAGRHTAFVQHEVDVDLARLRAHGADRVRAHRRDGLPLGGLPAALLGGAGQGDVGAVRAVREEDPHVLVADSGAPEARQPLSVEGHAGHARGERLHSGDDGSMDRHGHCPFVCMVGLSASPGDERTELT